MTGNLTHTRLCEICDSFALCQRIVKDNPRCGIKCSEIRKLVSEIIEKNLDNQEEEW